MHTIKNLTNSPHDLSIRLAANGSVTAEFAPEYLAAYEAMGYFEVTPAEVARPEPIAAPTPAADPLDHDEDGKKGGTATEPEADEGDDAIVALLLDGSAEEVATFIDDEKPSDAILRAYIEAKTGKKAHPNAKTETLAEKAKEAAKA